jgi:hypothetical protein
MTLLETHRSFPLLARSPRNCFKHLTQGAIKLLRNGADLVTEPAEAG